MTLPNMLIIGAQKSGTTWLHNVLNISRYFSGSENKELNFFNKPDISSVEDYKQNFVDLEGTAEVFYESTPHYFRLPSDGIDVAKNVKDILGDIPLILMLRDPVERYLSAYTHHMMQGRVPNIEVLTDVNEHYRMVELGRYAIIYEHFSQYFSCIYTHLYDDLVEDKQSLINKVMSQFEFQNDIPPKKLEFQTNSKDRKAKRLKIDVLPRLSSKLEKQLKDVYHVDVLKTQELIGRDLSNWL